MAKMSWWRKEVKEKEKESDQSKFSMGIRDLKNVDPDDGKFGEFEVLPSYRRDPEESRYDEAGQPVRTQGDVEMEKLKNE
jgi:hypothetical protein